MTDWSQCPHLSGIKAELDAIKEHSRRTFETVREYIDREDEKNKCRDDRMNKFDEWKLTIEGFIRGVKFTGTALSKLGKYLWIALGGTIIYLLQHFVTIAHAMFS